MKTVETERKIKLRITYDGTRKGARAFVMNIVREMMNSRSDPIPFEINGASAEFGSYTIKRIW